MIGKLGQKYIFFGIRAVRVSQGIEEIDTQIGSAPGLVRSQLPKCEGLWAARPEFVENAGSFHALLRCLFILRLYPVRKPTFNLTDRVSGRW